MLDGTVAEVSSTVARKVREVISLHKVGRLSRTRAAKAAKTVRANSFSKKTATKKKSVTITKDKTATGRKAVTFRAAKSRKFVVKESTGKRKTPAHRSKKSFK